ncbi:MAG: hypothetical protein KGL39_23040 [Patescibacteria group bacterium]|nr:hypothetical protein [Patescibacteria group bacterium]
MVQGNTIEVTGVRETIAALAAFTPEIKKGLNATIRAALQQTRDRARSIYPNGDWAVRVTKKNLLGTIAARGGQGADPKKSWSALPGGARAGVFEFIGTRYAGNRPQVQGLINSLNARYGQPGRFLWASWESTGEDVLATIRDATLIAEARLQESLNAAGEAF